MTQLSQDLGEELMKLEGRSPHDFAMAEKGSLWDLGTETQRLGADGKEIHVGRVEQVEQVPCDLPVERSLCGESLVLVGKLVGSDIHFPRMRTAHRENRWLMTSWKRSFVSFQRSWECIYPLLFVKETTVE